jgi:hypothetical protein
VQSFRFRPMLARKSSRRFDTVEPVKRFTGRACACPNEMPATAETPSRALQLQGRGARLRGRLSALSASSQVGLSADPAKNAATVISPSLVRVNERSTSIGAYSPKMTARGPFAFLSRGVPTRAKFGRFERRSKPRPSMAYLPAAPGAFAAIGAGPSVSGF